MDILNQLNITYLKPPSGTILRDFIILLFPVVFIRLQYFFLLFICLSFGCNRAGAPPYLTKCLAIWDIFWCQLISCKIDVLFSSFSLYSPFDLYFSLTVVFSWLDSVIQTKRNLWEKDDPSKTGQTIVGMSLHLKFCFHWQWISHCFRSGRSPFLSNNMQCLMWIWSKLILKAQIWYELNHPDIKSSMKNKH